jgi:hypothetical protein
VARIDRIATIVTFVALVLAGCGSAPSVTGSPSPTATREATRSQAPAEPDQSNPASTVPGAAIILNRAPADLGCDSIGWPDDVEPFQSLTFHIDPAALDTVTAVTDTGIQLLVSWVPGFEPGPAADRVVLGPDGSVVARDGDVLPLVPPGARLHGYPICLTPTELSVMLASG